MKQQTRLVNPTGS